MQILVNFSLRYFLGEMDWRVAGLHVISRPVVKPSRENMLIRLLVSCALLSSLRMRLCRPSHSPRP